MKPVNIGWCSSHNYRRQKAIAADNAHEKEIIGSNFLPPTNFLWPFQIVLLFKSNVDVPNVFMLQMRNSSTF